MGFKIRNPKSEFPNPKKNMPNRQVIQTNVTWGELSPLIEARVDLAQYANGAKTLDNFFVLQQGGASKRPGTRFITNMGTPTHIRLIPFCPSSTDSYILVFVPTAMYVFKDGDQVRTYPTPQNVTSITRTGNVATATVTGHGYSDGDAVKIEGADQADYNGTFRITNITPDTFDYIVQNSPVTPATGTITAKVGVVVSIVTPYAGADLADIKYTQKNDVLYLVHKDYAPRKISRLSDTSWTIAQEEFKRPPTQEGKFDLSETLKPNKTTGEGIVFVAGSSVFQKGDIGRIIKLNGSLSEATIVSVEPDAIAGDVKDVTTLTRSGTTATATVTGHGYSNGNKITILGADQDEYNGTKNISNVTADTFDYNLSSKPKKPATGTIVCYKSAKTKDVVQITRSGSEATVEATSHGYSDDDVVKISGADQDEYNGEFDIYDVDTNTFKIQVSGTPATPATGTIYCRVKYPSNVVTADIVVDFPNTDEIASGDWYLEGSVDADITLSARGPTGSLVRITSDRTAFRSSDVGKYIVLPRTDGGVAKYKIQKYKNRKKIKALTLHGLTKDDSLTFISNAWSIEEEIWSSTNGYPRAIAFFNDRLFYGGSKADPQTIWGSRVGSYRSFTGGSRDDDALQFTINAPGLNTILWLAESRNLVCGTSTGEFEISGSNEAPISPSNVTIRNHSNLGSNKVVPIRVGQEILFVQRTGRKVRALGYEFGSDGYIAQDITILAEHITEGGIVDIAYQQEPHSIVYMVRNDGKMVAMTYNREQKVVAGARYVLGDNALHKNDAVIPHPDGDRDQVWLAVKRGSDYHIEVFEDEGYYGNIYVDNAFVYNGASINKVIGLSRFNGKTVNIVVDGLKQASQVVANGTVDLNPGGQKIEIGLPYTSTFKILRPEIQTETGTRQGKQVRWNEIVIRLYNTIKLKVEGTDVDSLGNSLYTGDVRVANLGWDRDGCITITHDEPYPCTILGIMGNLTYAD